MKISIITPVYNDPRVSKALDSILCQEYEGEIELIVIDGGSDTPTLDILQKYQDRISVFVSEPDNGVYDAMNKGIKFATGDIIGILNADDRYCNPFVLRDVANAFKDSQTDACYGDLVYIDHQDRIVRYWKSGQCRLWKFYFGWMPPHPTFFVRKQLYEKCGIFDLRYPIAADYELMLRFILKYRISVKYIPRVLVKMSIGGKSNRSLSNVVKANIEVWQAWKNNDLSFGYLVPLLKPAQKVVQFIRARSKKLSQPVDGITNGVR